jgi:hypothetical protein
MAALIKCLQLLKSENIMNVSELIELLKSKDPEAIVVVDAYESGFTKIDSAEAISVELSPSQKSYNGDYKESRFDDNMSINAVYLSRFVEGKE